MNRADKKAYEEGGGRERDMERRLKENAGFTEKEIAAAEQILPQRFTPIGKMICLQRIKVIQQTRSGIHLPDQNKVLNLECWVLAVGPEVKQVKRGDRVLLSGFAGCASCFYKDEDTRITLEEGILGIIDPKEYPEEKYDKERDCIIRALPDLDDETT